MVPSVLPALVKCSSVMVGAESTFSDAAGAIFASPKSRIFACPLSIMKMFAGLMSR